MTRPFDNLTEKEQEKVLLIFVDYVLETEQMRKIIEKRKEQLMELEYLFEEETK